MCADLWERRSSFNTSVASLDGETSQPSGSEEWEPGAISPQRPRSEKNR